MSTSGTSQTRYLMLLKRIKSLNTALCVSLCISLGVCSPIYAIAAASNKDAKQIDQLIQGYQEPGKSELRKAITFATGQHKGRVLSAKPIFQNQHKNYKIRMLLDSGHIKTFYINENATAWREKNPFE